MADKDGRDRRQGYSFPAHFRRIIEKRGWRQVVGVLGTAVAVGGILFASCSTDKIAGPNSPPVSGATKQAMVIPIDVGPAVMPATLPPTACNGDPVVWTDTKTNTLGKIVVTTSGVFQLKVHVSQTAKGYGSDQNPVKPRLNYVGTDEYDQEVTFAPNNDVVNVEFNLKVIAKGEAGPDGVAPLSPGDDFMLHMLLPVRSNGQVEPARAETRCQ